MSFIHIILLLWYQPGRVSRRRGSVAGVTSSVADYITTRELPRGTGAKLTE